MRSIFPGHYRPRDFKELWRTARIAIDANVLLNIYGYSEATREQIVALFEGLKGRLWMPYQFALEYQRNRHKSIAEQVQHYVTVEQTLKQIQQQHFRAKKKHPFVEDEALAAFDALIEELRERRKLEEALFSDDPHFERISAVFDGLVGAQPDEETLAELHREAKRRIDAKIPPGFADFKDKGEPGAFGDYIGWAQIIQSAQAERCSVILVTDDLKEDWWSLASRYKLNDRVLCPRVELVEEFRTKCRTEFWMYSLEQFVRFAQEALGATVDPEVVEEIREQQEERREEYLRTVVDDVPQKAVRADSNGEAPPANPDAPKARAPIKASVRKETGIGELAEDEETQRPRQGDSLEGED